MGENGSKEEIYFGFLFLAFSWKTDHELTAAPDYFVVYHTFIVPTCVCEAPAMWIDCASIPLANF